MSGADAKVVDKSQAALLLKKQLKQLNKNPIEGFSAGLVNDDNIYEWQFCIIGPPDTFYEGGFFNGTLSFPKDYPQSPPTMHFTTRIWHPNVNIKDGKVCISILHPPGDDEFGYESASLRWNPIHTVESIILSVITMLADPNGESAENIDAAKELREKPEEFKKNVKRCVRRSQDS